MSVPMSRGVPARGARGRSRSRSRPSAGAASAASLVAARARAALLGASLVAASAAGATGAGTSAPAPGDCLAELDAAVRLAENDAADLAAQRLEALSARCPHLPQIDHGLGVLAARAGRPREAIARLEASLAADRRAAGTLAQLRALHRHEATLAYARALGVPSSAPPPVLALQDSSVVNAEALRPRLDRSELRTLVAVEYELYDWWHSATVSDPAAWLAHYAADYPEEVALEDRGRLGRTPWEGVRREVAFTAEDAVAVLEHGTGAVIGRRLLLLRLEGDRWKIYRETPL